MFGKQRPSLSPEALGAVLDLPSTERDDYAAFESSSSVTDASTLGSSGRAAAASTTATAATGTHGRWQLESAAAVGPWNGVGTATRRPSAAIGRAFRNRKHHRGGRAGSRSSSSSPSKPPPPKPPPPKPRVVPDVARAEKDRDPTAAPRPARSAYALYLASQRKEARREPRPENVVVPPVKETNRLASQRWREMTSEARSVWEGRAAEEKARHRKELAAVRAKNKGTSASTSSDGEEAAGGGSKDVTLGELMRRSNKKRGPWYSS